MILIRRAQAHDHPFLAAMLVEAVNWDPGRVALSAETLAADPSLDRYVTGWPRSTDLGVVAEDGAPRVRAGRRCRGRGHDAPGSRFRSELTPGGAPARTSTGRTSRTRIRRSILARTVPADRGCNRPPIGPDSTPARDPSSVDGAASPPRRRGNRPLLPRRGCSAVRAAAARDPAGRNRFTSASHWLGPRGRASVEPDAVLVGGIVDRR